MGASGSQMDRIISSAQNATSSVGDNALIALYIVLGFLACYCVVLPISKCLCSTKEQYGKWKQCCCGSNSGYNEV